MNYNGEILYKLDSKNKVRVWFATTDFLKSEEGVTITISHGLEAGKQTSKLRYVLKGKNIGKSNETSVEEQTQLVINSLYQSQLDSGYVLNLEDFKVRERPVLAEKFEEKKHKIDWTKPQYASTKLNGIRGFTKVFPDSIRYESREENLFKNFHHLEKDIRALVTSLPCDTVYIDAEIFCHGMPFEVISTLVNTQEYTTCLDEDGKEWKTEDLQLHVYDLIFPKSMDLVYSERFLPHKDKFNTLTSLKWVEQYLVTSEQEFEVLFLGWLKDRHEGGMLRSDVAYEFHKRSINLLKWKVMLSEEFLISSVYTAENDSTKVMFTLVNHLAKSEKHNSFKCGIEGNKTNTIKLLEEKEEIEGKKWMTVDYQALSSYNVPLFPVGVGIREGKYVNGTFVPFV